MNLALEEQTILITRSLEQALEFRRLLEAEGARVLELPTICIQPRPEAELDRAVSRLSGADWLMFTSVNAVNIFMDHLQSLGKMAQLGENTRIQICTIGPATARRVGDYGCQVNLVPEVYQAEGVLEAFSRYHRGNLEGLRILLPRASEARQILPQTLRHRGAVVDLIPVYDTLIPEESRTLFNELFRDEPPDLITFTSSSTVRNFLELAHGLEDVSGLRCAAIGPVTAATAAEQGLQIVVQPEKSTIPDLAEAIVAYFRQEKPAQPATDN